MASARGFVNVVKYLIENGFSDKNEIDNFGRTALHLATLLGEYFTSDFLLTNQADANSKDNFGMTPIHYAASIGHISLIELLIRKGGADVNERDNLNRTAFHLAMWSDVPINVAHYLLDNAEMDLEAKVSQALTFFKMALMFILSCTVKQHYRTKITI